MFFVSLRLYGNANRRNKCSYYRRTQRERRAALSHVQAIGKELVIIVESPSLIMIHRAAGEQENDSATNGAEAAP